MTRPPALELRGVTRSFGDPPLEILHGIDLRVEHGELVAIVGPSGSGKSTLLNILGTLDRPTTGTVHIDGIDASTLDDRSLSRLRAWRIGFVFQQFLLLAERTAAENVADGLLYTGMPPRERRERAHEALERVGLSHRAHHRPGELSGGEQQRVSFARAIVVAPAVVLADEPTGNLDSRTGADIIDLIHGLHADGTTILVITHDHATASGMPRQVTLRDGRIVDDAASVSAPAGIGAGLR